MEGHQHSRRSPSVGHSHNANINNQSSSQRYQDNPTGLGLDPAINPSTFTTSVFNGNPSASGADGFNATNNYLDSNSQANLFQPHILPSNDFTNQGGLQKYNKQRNSVSSGQQRPQQLNLQDSNHGFTSATEFLNSDLSTNDYADSLQAHDASVKQEQNFDPSFMVDPSLQPSGPVQQQSINPADIMSNMSSPQTHMVTPPNLLPPDARSSAGQSPSSQQGQFYSPKHSRHASLDPSAAFSQAPQPTDWTGMLGNTSFQHRRAPSEHSEVSSVAPSPFLQQQDAFDQFEPNHSPMLNPQQDNVVYQDALERFSLSDVQQQQHAQAQQQQQQQIQHHQQQLQQQRGISPGHSPFVSPRMSPHQGLGLAPDNPFILGSNDVSSQYNGGPGPEIYERHFRHQSTDMGQAAQMAPPEINVELAPPSRQHFEPSRGDSDLDALSPPDRGRRGRIRAKSDPSFAPMSRPMTPGETLPNLNSHEPLVQQQHQHQHQHQRNRSLSPFDGAFPSSLSRDASPAGKSSRRSSTSSIPNRDYILELADPNRPSASGTDRTRVQKHPATFQCTLCPKRFTRAYNLRSHLRTHTDERPFVCTVCGKAFARQHDRKRHEGLHSGEKKFVCRGELGAGGIWGCGRRFARADALGRHFRSEAGRVCIKPLLEEEALERQRVEQLMASGGGGGQQPMMQSGMDINGGNAGGFTLPAALLAQYPALQGLQWDQLGSGPGGPGDEGELSGRSSFDASSGGDYFEDEIDEGGYVSGPGTGYASAGSWAGQQGGHDWASDYEGR